MSKHTKQEMQEMEFEEVNNANYDTVKWEPQPGEFLIGEYVEKKEECGMDNYTFFIIDDGEDKYSLLSNTVLNSLFEDIVVGTVLKITYEGMKKSLTGSREYKAYTIQKAKPVDDEFKAYTIQQSPWKWKQYKKEVSNDEVCIKQLQS